MAYVVPDRELPLVNIQIYVRTGDYVEPAGKEGLADMTGYLIARGGTPTKNSGRIGGTIGFPRGGLRLRGRRYAGERELEPALQGLDEGCRSCGMS